MENNLYDLFYYRCNINERYLIDIGSNKGVGLSVIYKYTFTHYSLFSQKNKLIRRENRSLSPSQRELKR